MTHFRLIPETPEGIVAVGGDLDPETLIQAYRAGIFPWPIEGLPLTWFSPRERAILEFHRLRIPRSLARYRARYRARHRRTNGLQVTWNTAFSEVICACAKVPRPGQEGTWITPKMIQGYTALHQLGFAHSLEAWMPADGSRSPQLVAGLYGVGVDGAFAAESMFYKKPNASKLLLWELMEALHAHGLNWIDIQVMTPHLERLGARLIPRDEFLVKLAQTRAHGLRSFPWSV